MGIQIRIIVVIIAIFWQMPLMASQVQDGDALNQHFHPEIQDIVNRGYLIVAMLKDDSPPFFMKDQKGEFVGLDVEIAKKIAGYLGVRVKFHRESETFDQVIDTVARGDADIGISKLSYTAARAMKVLFSKPYLVLKKALLMNRILHARLKKDMDANTLEELFKVSEGTISVIQGSSYEYYAQKLFPKATLIPLKSWATEIIPSVLEGKALAAFRDDLEIKKFFLLNPKANLVVRAIILKSQTDPIQMVIPPTKYFLQQWLDKFIERDYTDLTVDSLLNRYESYFRGSNDFKGEDISSKAEIWQGG
jgi:ABC-type amino acid transport substrate-binding protein